MFPGPQEQEGREAYPLGGTLRTEYLLERAQNSPVSLVAAEIFVSHPQQRGAEVIRFLSALTPRLAANLEGGWSLWA